MIRFTAVRRMALLLTVFVALLLAGCAPSVVGKWEGNMAGDNPMGVNAKGTMEFKQDGKFEQSLSMPMIGTVSATGTYKVNGEKMELKTEDVFMGGKSVKGMIPPDLTKQVMADQTVTVKVEGDKLTMDTGKGKATLTRTKQ